jgi:hypothetical protein
MDDPNADPTNLTLDRLYQSVVGAMLGITLNRRPLAWAEQEGATRCECGGPATLWSTDLLSSHGKMVLLCDACAAKVVTRVSRT